MSAIRFEPIETVIYGAEEARLMLIDNKLAAVLVRLGDGYGELAQSWHAEAAFDGFEPLSQETFPDLAAVERWVCERPAAAASGL